MVLPPQSNLCSVWIFKKPFSLNPCVKEPGKMEILCSYCYIWYWKFWTIFIHTTKKSMFFIPTINKLLVLICKSIFENKLFSSDQNDHPHKKTSLGESLAKSLSKTRFFTRARPLKSDLSGLFPNSLVCNVWIKK